jgi:hypothetical protein
MIRNLLFLSFSLLFLVSCDTGLDGNLKPNQLPKTYLTVNSINLPEGERLNSQIRISWWGDDPDGYVVGYEIHIGDRPEEASAVWTFTTRTDSTFILPIQQGNTDADVKFTVRAVDNDQDRDPEPPSLVFPIRNSPPRVQFVAQETPPDTTFNVFSFGIRATDPDGNANLNRIEISLNSTSDADWKEIAPNTQLLTMIIDEDDKANVFIGRSLLNADLSFQQIRWNANNTFYVRSIDNAGAVSPVIQYEWFIKKKQSNVLFLNDYFGPNSQSVANLHMELLRSVGIDRVDYIDISDGSAIGGNRVVLSSAFPNRSLAAPTINRMLAQWDHIYWVSDNLDRNIGYALELTFDFFQNGGTMFVNIPTKVLFDDNPVLEFLPFERVQPVPQGQQSFIISNNAEVSATIAVPNAPYLRFRRNLLASFPIIPFGETVELFNAPFRTRNAAGIINNFQGSNLISAMNPEQTILFFGIDLTEFDINERTILRSGEQVTLPASDLTRLIQFTTRDILKFEP